MRVSVVIACYNGARFLHESIASARDQSVAPHEIVVVDDGSLDDSARIAASFPEVLLVRQSNQGASRARNRGVAESSGEGIVFHDADDRLLPSALDAGVRALAAHPDCGFVYGTSRSIRADGTPVAQPPRPHVDDASYARLLEGDALVPPSCALFRRDALDEVGGFRESQAIAEDYELYLRVARCFPIHCHNELVAEYRRHEHNATSSASHTLRGVLATLEAQRPALEGRPELIAALERGRRHWARVFGPSMAFECAGHLRHGRLGPAAATLGLVLRHHPRGLADVVAFHAKQLLGKN